MTFRWRKRSNNMVEKKPAAKKPAAAKKPVAHKKPAAPKAHVEKPKATEPVAAPVAAAAVEAPKQTAAKVTQGKNFYAVGRRKTAVAQILLSGGDGTITINKLPFEKYFMVDYLRQIARQPLASVGLEKAVGIRAKIQGGGIHAQAEALRHAITRAVVAMDPDTRRQLKKLGFLTRDPRVKERKKPGLKRARRAPQFSKR
jgi:small subunit ribosomal protein S9